jgi:DeoR family lactose phosphotransferase system repressor
MLKKERLEKIIEKVNSEGVITVNDIIKELGVSDMTVRRDLDELDKEGRLIRIHGGAQRVDSKFSYEKSNFEKQGIQIEEKKEIARFASQFVAEGETIFIGPGTTLEYFASELVSKNIRVVTNSLPVFTILNQNKTTDLILTGGEYRDITGAFVGSLTESYLHSLKFSKAFVSANGVFQTSVATYSENEGIIQKIALENAIEKFLLVDNEKFDKYDFYEFYNLTDIDILITDSKISDKTREKYRHITTIKTNQ